ncbi:MAG TPA: D-aminoacylase [bacterium]|nr:D-aminoacylase [bacterium]
MDLIIRHGTLVDGTGAPGVRADVGIAGGEIAAIGDLRHQRGAAEWDARDRVVAPGFIDMHTHCDFTIFERPQADSYLLQGVTCIVVGNCGFSPAPLNPRRLDEVRQFTGLFDADLPWSWRTFDEYLSAVERERPGVNVVSLVGLGAVRIAAIGFEKRPAAAAEIAEMARLVEDAMRAGARGVSTGLIYPPGSFADTDEVVAVASAARAAGGFYSSHIRGEGHTLLPAIREALEIGRRAGRPVHVSHLKAAGRRNWGKVADALRLLDEARATQDVTFDQYPYTMGSTLLAAGLPQWAHDGGMGALLRRLRDGAARRRIGAEIDAGLPGWHNLIGEAGWDRVFISNNPAHPEFNGRTLAEIGRLWGRTPCDAALDLLLDGDGAVGMVVGMMSEDDVRTVMRHPLMQVGSDGWVMGPYGRGAAARPHPRSYGTFPRVLGPYVRDERILTLEEAVARMTSRPARRLGLRRRGVVRVGTIADLVVFDPARVRDTATYADPHRFPVGITAVLVAGQVAAREGTLAPARAGHVLRGGRAA